MTNNQAIALAQAKAKTWIYRNARPLEFARYRCLLEGDDSSQIGDILKFYQNDDGGFGHALEADSWNPASSPIQTWTATTILTDFKDHKKDIISSILRYLTSGQQFQNSKWEYTIPSNNDFPHAPWWSHNNHPNTSTDFNPTAALAGFGLLYAKPNSALHQSCMTIVQNAITHLLNPGYTPEMHELVCFVQLLEYCEQCDQMKIQSFFPMERFRVVLREKVSSILDRDKDKWNDGYTCRPSRFIKNKQSVFYLDNQELADLEVSHIIAKQQVDGSWPIAWNWEGNEWFVAEQWWKASQAIDYCQYLKEVGAK